MSYTLSRKAEEDIISIYLEGATQFGTQQADHYHRQLEETFRFLSDNPEAARQRFELTPPARIHPHQSHLVVYTIDENRDIFIIRIRHSHEDWL
jgi:toxin ParE1/3/4